MDEDILKEIKHIKRLLVLLCTKDVDQKRQIHMLNSVGFQPKEIAELIGTTANTVRVGKSRIKKERKIDKQKTKAGSS